MFTNPLIARLRLKNTINLNALIHNDYDYRRSSIHKVQKDNKPKINLNVLL